MPLSSNQALINTNRLQSRNHKIAQTRRSRGCKSSGEPNSGRLQVSHWGTESNNQYQAFKTADKHTLGDLNPDQQSTPEQRQILSKMDCASKRVNTPES